MDPRRAQGREKTDEELEREAEARRAAEERIRAEQLLHWRNVMRTESGRSVIYEILEETGFFEKVFEPNSTIYYNAGKRDVGGFLLGRVLEGAQDQYLPMMTEAFVRMKARKGEEANR